METFITLLCLAALAVLGQGQDPMPALSVSFADPSDRYVSVGDKDLTFQCIINRPLAYIYGKQVVHLINKKPNGEELVLYEGQKRKEAEPSFYDLKREEVDNVNTFTFKILKVREKDEGKLICRSVPNQGTEGSDKAEAEVEIFIKRKIESLHLHLDNKTEAIAYTVDPRSYPVKCTATGSNPAVTNVKLFLNNQPIEGELTTVQPVATEYRFDTTLTATVEFTVDNSGQDLECVAEQPFDLPEGEQKMVTKSATLEVNNYTPVVDCKEGKAYSGMLLAKLICTVDHSGLDIKEFKYSIENPKRGNIELRVDGKTSDDSVVKLKSGEDSKTTVTLILAQTEDWHFESEFFLVVENKGGFVTRVPVTLTELPDPNNSSASLTTTLTVLLAVSTAVLLRL